MQMKIEVTGTTPKGKHTTKHSEQLSEIVTRAQAIEFATLFVNTYVPEIQEQATLDEDKPAERRVNRRKASE